MSLEQTFNPAPLSKIFVTLLISFSLIANINEVFISSTVVFLSIFFVLNNRVKTAVNTVVSYGVILLIIYYLSKIDNSFVSNYVVILVLIVKIFFSPFLAGKFLVQTSDISSLIVSFEKIHLPKVIVIPLAVVFRYFPAFKEDRKNIKMAMKMRDITFRNPLKYIEYVSVPMLISAINISDDIAKAAETRCIDDPVKKIRYTEVKFKWIDVVFVGGIIALNILGRIYA